MADRYINKILHRTEKIFYGECSLCGKPSGCLWKVSEVLANTLHNKEVGKYCIRCTKNSWAASFKLYRESLS